jgi:hypothetical protein
MPIMERLVNDSQRIQFLPEYGGVANAIGAVVGQITMRETGKVISAGEGAWRVFIDDAPQDYNEQEKALTAPSRSS